MTDDRRSLYSERLQERRTEIGGREHRQRQLGYARLAIFACAIGIVWAALATGAFSVVWVLVPIAAFTALLVIGDRLQRALEHRRRAARYFEQALARLNGDWAGRGASGDAYRDPAHPYALDLDLFGKGSLFELLCAARTHIGEDTLARWLMSPASPQAIRARQQGVEELRPRVDLREDLAVVAEEARTGVNPVALAAWGEAPPLLDPRAGVLVGVFTVVGVIGFAAFLTFGLEWLGVAPLGAKIAIAARYVFLVALLANGTFIYRRRQAMEAVIAAVDEAAHEIGLLTDVLVRLEQEQFRSPLLSELRASLDAEGEPPSKRLSRLKRLAEDVDSRDNLFVRMLEVFILWTPHLAVKVEDWRRHSGGAVRRWLTAVGEIEALCSLASHAFEHPADGFPEVDDFPGVAKGFLEAEAMGHPLLPEDRVVRNDARIGAPARVLIVSGSNMSGKSTFLRTIGSNAVLAQAGSVVRARKLRMSPVALGASIRVTDSLQEGVSRFYAEILRLRQILDETAGPLPVLFLIDEFLHGTNSHDRRIGAQALVRSLVERGAIGLVTTHDLALADIADSLGEQAMNVHFEDHVEAGQIRFDYVMRPGVVRKSNAIELMRSVGLEI